MSFSYDPRRATDRDWVRGLIGDTVAAKVMLQDEEIDAIVATRPATDARKYLAAADALVELHTRWMSRGKGMASKKVERLAVVYGSGAGINVDAAIQLRIKELRIMGAQRLSPRPFAFRML